MVIVGETINLVQLANFTVKIFVKSKYKYLNQTKLNQERVAMAIHWLIESCLYLIDVDFP